MSGGYFNRALRAHADRIEQVYEDAVEDAMSGCNATVEIVGDDAVCQTWTCQHQSGHVTKHLNLGAHLLWEDTTPGAKPHTPPRYRVAHNQTGDGWLVRDGTAEMAAWFTSTHPDPHGAAEAEADRLNGEDDGDSSAVRGPLRDALWGTP